jgi:hypothetical protein
MKGSAAFPEKKDPVQKPKQKKSDTNHQKIIDSSKEDVEENNAALYKPNIPPMIQMKATKRQKNQKRSAPKATPQKGKMVHWNEAEPSSNPSTHNTQTPFPSMYSRHKYCLHSMASQGCHPPFFQPAPMPFHPTPFAPVPHMQQIQSSFQNSHKPKSTHIQPNN